MRRTNRRSFSFLSSGVHDSTSCIQLRTVDGLMLVFNVSRAIGGSWIGNHGSWREVETETKNRAKKGVRVEMRSARVGETFHLKYRILHEPSASATRVPTRVCDRPESPGVENATAVGWSLERREIGV